MGTDIAGETNLSRLLAGARRVFDPKTYVFITADDVLNDPGVIGAFREVEGTTLIAEPRWGALALVKVALKLGGQHVHLPHAVGRPIFSSTQMTRIQPDDYLPAIQDGDVVMVEWSSRSRSWST